jgi:hypothetical protein
MLSGCRAGKTTVAASSAPSRPRGRRVLLVAADAEVAGVLQLQQLGARIGWRSLGAAGGAAAPLASGARAPGFDA